MRSIHPFPLVVGLVWIVTVTLAWLASDLSANAGHLPSRWVSLGMLSGFAYAGVVVAAVTMLPEALPRLVRRLLAIGGMAGAMWSAGTLGRALYAVLA